MKPPSTPPDEDENICPDCGSTNIEQTKEREYIVQPGNRIAKEYRCKDCGIKYFPALEHVEIQSDSQKLIEKWSYKTDQSSYMERKKQNKNKTKIYIQIRELDKE